MNPRLRILALALACLLAALGSVLARAAAPGVLILDNGGEASEVTRGWPAHVHWYALASRELGQTLIVRSAAGPQLSVQAVTPGQWWLSPEQTGSFPLGNATAQVGEVALAVHFVDRSEPLPPEHDEGRRLATIRFAMVSGQWAMARSEAEAWVAADPNLPMPRAVLADVLAGQGLLDEALDVFEASFERNAWKDRPPEDLFQRVNAVREQVFEGFPRVDPEPLAEPEPLTLEDQDRVYGADTNGQWAASAKASSEYRVTGDYSASAAIGAPDVGRYGDSPRAWASRLADSGLEWLEVSFSNPVAATAVRVRQVFNPGAIVAIELLDASGATWTVFSGVDTNTYAANQIAWFVKRFPRTERPVKSVRVTLDSARVKGWNEIDAIQLVAAPPVAVAAPTLTYRFQAATGILELSAWPAGFVLQRATRLDLPDWEVHALQPPVQLPVGGAHAFFRLAEAGAGGR